MVLATCVLVATEPHLELLAAPFQHQGIDTVVGVESRGFIFGCAVADRLGAGFTPVRKPGKLPWRCTGVDYTLEYGEGRLEVHDDAFEKGQR